MALEVCSSTRVGLPTLQVDGRLHVHKRQWHELCDAASALLQVPDGDEVARPFRGALHMAEHDGGRRAEPHLMCCLYHLHSHDCVRHRLCKRLQSALPLVVLAGL